MAQKSGVNWCDSAANPTINCEGCELWNRKQGVKICYAGTMYERFNPNAVPFGTKVQEMPGRMAECRKWSDLTGTNRPERSWLNGLPRIVFISDMSDAILAPFDYLYSEVIQVVRETPHLYLWLTKRPARMIDFALYLEQKGWWPQNLVPGVSVTNQASRERVSKIIEYPGWPKRPFVSYEPALEYVDLTAFDGYISMLILGGQSGVGSKQMSLDLAQRVYSDTLRKTNMAFFMKQLGGRNKLESLTDFPPALRVRDYPEEWYRKVEAPNV